MGENILNSLTNLSKCVIMPVESERIPVGTARYGQILTTSDGGVLLSCITVYGEAEVFFLPRFIRREVMKWDSTSHGPSSLNFYSSSQAWYFSSYPVFIGMMTMTIIIEKDNRPPSKSPVIF